MDVGAAVRSRGIVAVIRVVERLVVVSTERSSEEVDKLVEALVVGMSDMLNVKYGQHHSLYIAPLESRFEVIVKGFAQLQQLLKHSRRDAFALELVKKLVNAKTMEEDLKTKQTLAIRIYEFAEMLEKQASKTEAGVLEAIEKAANDLRAARDEVANAASNPYAKD